MVKLVMLECKFIDCGYSDLKTGQVIALFL